LRTITIKPIILLKKITNQLNLINKSKIQKVVKIKEAKIKINSKKVEKLRNNGNN